MKTMITGVTFGAVALLMLGLSPAASAAPSSTGSPSQDCKQSIEPIFQQLGVPIGHSTCVTLLNGAGPNGDVSICKFARDIGAIANNAYGKCVSSKMSANELFGGIFQVLLARGATTNQLVALLTFAEYWGVVNNMNIDFGPTALSAGVLASLLAGWIWIRRYRGAARLARY